MLNITLFAIFILTISKLSATTAQEITTSAEFETTPVCRKSISSKERKVLCQEKTLEIDCPYGTVVTFIDANFGRSSREPCHEFWGLENKNCRTNSHTLAVLRKRCSNTTSCRVLVSKDVFGSLDVCYKITKYLDVTYACEKEICQAQSGISKDRVTTTLPYITTQPNNNTSGQDEISADRITTHLPYNITRPDINTTEVSVNTRIDKDIVDNNTNDSKQTMSKSLTDNEHLTQRRVFTIIGSVLGVVLAIVIFTVVCLMAKQKRQLCSKTSLPTTTLEMQVTSDNNTGYEYDYSEVRTGPNSSECRRIPNEHSDRLDNVYENSKEHEGQIPTCSSGALNDTYDVTNGSSRTSVDVNNTYDHMFGEQTEDQYDIGLTTNTVMTQNVDDIYL